MNARVPGMEAENLMYPSRQMAMALPGLQLTDALVQAAQDTRRLQLAPLNQHYLLRWWDEKKNKLVEERLQLTREFLDAVVRNTQEYRAGNPVPVYIDHVTWGESFGWIDPVTLAVDEVYGLTCAEPRWVGGTAEKIAQERFKYVSPSIPLDAFDPQTGGKRGPYLQEASLTNNPYYIDQRGLAVRLRRGGAYRLVGAMTYQPKEDEVDLKKLATLAGLPAEASEEELEAAVQANAGVAAGMKQIAQAAGVPLDDVIKNLTANAALLKGGTPVEEPTPASGNPSPEGNKNAELVLGAPGKNMGVETATLIVEGRVQTGQIPPKDSARFVAQLATMDAASAGAFLALLPAPQSAPNLAGNADRGSEGIDLPPVEMLKAANMTAEDFRRFSQPRG